MIDATPYEAATALVLEARRQKTSYGRLTANMKPWEQDEIIEAYMRRKKERSTAVRRRRTKKM